MPSKIAPVLPLVSFSHGGPCSSPQVECDQPWDNDSRHPPVGVLEATPTKCHLFWRKNAGYLNKENWKACGLLPHEFIIFCLYMNISKYRLMSYDVLLLGKKNWVRCDVSFLNSQYLARDVVNGTLVVPSTFPFSTPKIASSTSRTTRHGTTLLKLRVCEGQKHACFPAAILALLEVILFSKESKEILPSLKLTARP